MPGRFRFGLQLSDDADQDPVSTAQRAEALGFDIVVVSDHVGPGMAPLPTLAAIAQATDTIRLGTFVLNNDMRNPVQVAWEAASIDRVSGGRFELGLGAGHTPQEYAATDIAFDAPKLRKERLVESVEIIRGLLDGERVDFVGDHYTVTGAEIDRTVQDHLPILIGGNGRALLEHAGAHADIIGFQGLGRTRSDGHRHAVKWDPAWLTAQVQQVRDGAGDRFDQLELNALAQVVQVTNDRSDALMSVCGRIEGLDPEHAAEMPYLLVGTVDEIAEHVVQCRRRWGITYFVVRELEEMAPVIAALR